MRLAIDCREITNKTTGISRFLTTFLEYASQSKEMKFILIGNRTTDFTHPALDKISEKVVIPEIYPTIIWDQIQLNIALREKKADIFYSPYYKFPILSSIPSIITIFDLIYLTEEPYRSSLKHNLYIKNFIKLFGHRAKTIITSTNYSAEMLHKMTNIPTDKIQVVYLALSQNKFSPQPLTKIEHLKNTLRINKKYILYVGNARPHKNLKKLIEAYKQLPSSLTQDICLILCGANDIDNSILPDGVIHLTNINDELLPSLYSGAEFLIFPSLAEGFGYPLIEALMCDCPVVCSDIPVFREILSSDGEKEDGWIHFNPHSVENIRDKILFTYQNLRIIKEKQLNKWIKLKKKFSPETMTEKLISIFKNNISSL